MPATISADRRFASTTRERPDPGTAHDCDRTGRTAILAARPPRVWVGDGPDDELSASMVRIGSSCR